MIGLKEVPPCTQVKTSQRIHLACCAFLSVSSELSRIYNYFVKNNACVRKVNILAMKRPIKNGVPYYVNIKLEIS